MKTKLKILWLAVLFLLPSLLADEPSYTLLAPPERASLPKWAQPGRMRYGRCDGGPLEICKAFMSGWEQIRQPDAILPCVNDYSDETIAMLKRARINWIWITWSVGFSFESEAVQRRLLMRFIAKCHAAGIRVTAYLSLTNMFIDDMVENVPQSANWMQVDADGTPRPYNAAKYEGKPTRILACLNHPEWLEYSKPRIASAVTAGVDGIFYDNIFHGCQCKLCQQKFAEFTQSLYGQPLPMPGTKIQATPGDTQGRETIAPTDAPGLAASAWKSFCDKTVSAALAQHRKYADSLKPGILVYANTHRQPFENDGLNALFTETGHEPGLRGTELSSNIGLYKFYYAEGDGCKPIRIECGRRIHAERMDNLMPPRNEMLAVYEGAACQGSQQTFTEMGFTTKMARGDKDARDSLVALTTANQWLAEHESLFAEVEPIAKTAVVPTPYEPLTPLVRAGKNFVVLQPKHLTLRQLAQFELVILLNIRCMTDEQMGAVLGYMKQGGRVIATGGTASCDSAFRPRAKPALTSRKLTTEELLAEWQRLEDKPLVQLVSAPENVCFNVARSWDGKRTLVYLLNYGPQPVAGCEVKLNLPKQPRSLRFHTPGSKPRQLNGGKIPTFDLFAVLEIR